VLAKCANPTCSAPFRRLTEGKLFQVETRYPSTEGLGARKHRASQRVEHFWLCSDCARLVTLAFHEDRGLVTVPLADGNVVRRVKLVEFNRRPALPTRPDSGVDDEFEPVWESRYRS
jgi:hypothetical protein